MRFLSTRAHGVIDYVMGILIIAAPWIFGFARNGVETWVPVAVGAAGLVYSICTNYELGLVKSISMPTHLTLDLFSGLLLAVSPWLFGFAEYVYVPHLLFGILEMGASLVTEKSPSERTSHTEHTPRVVH